MSALIVVFEDQFKHGLGGLAGGEGGRDAVVLLSRRGPQVCARFSRLLAASGRRVVNTKDADYDKALREAVMRCRPSAIVAAEPGSSDQRRRLEDWAERFHLPLRLETVNGARAAA